uniref:Uncharacterized protein n=1 Tax=Phlebotomus papatasi TaxID=29031 RepID=A0A1B0DIN2_PHLPP
LRTISVDTVLQIGANVPLTEVICELRKASETRSDFFYCRQIAKHIEQIAHSAVRNVGTIAGNLSIKHQHNEFVSDIYILLEAIGATLTIISSGGSIRIVGIADYMKINMKNRIIVKITLPSLPKKQYEFFSYKVTSRAQNTLALVNCAFLFKFNADHSMVLNAKLCFGGLNPHFTHATCTENFLMNQNLFKDSTIQAACLRLEKELVLDWVLPAPCPEYRKMVAIGLFYKAVVGICPSDRVRPEIRSVGQDIERMLSCGEQYFSDSHIHKPIIKLEAIGQCTGDVKYINDMPYMPNEVWGAFVCSSEASATINMPGVVAFYGAKDITGMNNCCHPVMEQFESQELFSSGRIIYHGQPIGMIIAATLDIAQAAATQVVVTYRRDINTRPIVSIKDAVEESFFSQQKHVGRDMINPLNAISNGLDTAHTFSGQFEVGAQYHFTMEPQTTICIPNGDGIDVYCSTQWLNFVKVIIAQVLNIPENLISIKVKNVGGAYGGKLYSSVFAAAACALACRLQRRPVRFVLSLETCMIALGKRFPGLTEYKVDVSTAGKIQKLNQEIWLDFGAVITNALDRTVTTAVKNCYNFEFWSVKGKCMKTDTPPNTWCRSPGHVVGFAMIENIMEHISRVVNCDPLDIRLENIPEDSLMKKILQDFAKSVCYRERKVEMHSYNHMNRWKKQGNAIVPLKYEVEYIYINTSSVFVNTSDGTVNVILSGVEVGQGLNTKIAQIVSKTLNVPLSFVKACKEILHRMEPVRKEMGDVPWRELTQECFKRSIPLSSMQYHQPNDSPNYDVWAAAYAEVEIDIITGAVIVKRVDIVEDVGKSINPHIDIGQIEGAFVMGLGYWLHEQVIHDRFSGELTTRNTWTYRIPGAKDIPSDFRVTLLDTCKRDFSSVLGSKAVGDPATCLGAVLPLAVRYALDSARQDAGLDNEWYQLNCPLTPEQIQQNSGTKLHQFQL